MISLLYIKLIMNNRSEFHHIIVKEGREVGLKIHIIVSVCSSYDTIGLLTFVKGDRHMSHHILLVEDDISIQEMVEKYLIKEGFQVTIASDGEEGVNTYLKGSFDLIILDIMMPKLDGLEVVRIIREKVLFRF